MTPIKVRPLSPGEERIWVGLGPPSEDPEADAARLAERLRSRSDERTFLLAFEGGRCAGRLEGLFLNPNLFFVRELLAVPGAGARGAERALTGHLRGSFAKDGIRVLSWDSDRSAPLNAALRDGGFRVAKTKLLFERSLEGYASPYDDPFSYETLDEVGRSAFVALLGAASEGDPFEDPVRDFDREFQELVDHAAGSFDPAWWLAASIAGERAGVVLPQRFPDTPDEGTLFYVGVLPAHRRRGHGKVLHAAGLSFLARHGVAKYVGSTDSRNAPMRAVFAANGCRETKKQLFFEAGE